jgi:ABC-2 type transport system ATP-binding protein
MSDAVRCERLVKRFEAVVAVDGLSLAVPRGECFGLLGPNGAGKTTTVEILEGLLAPDSGEVEILGCRWTVDEAELRQRLGIQLQETQLNEKLTVEETVRLFRSFYDRGYQIADLIAMVELDAKRDSRRTEAAAGARMRACRQTGSAVSRRTDDRPRSAVAAAILGSAPQVPR